MTLPTGAILTHELKFVNLKVRRKYKFDLPYETRVDFIWSLSLSLIIAINSEFVGFPFRLLIVYPKYELKVSRSPLSHATSMA